MELSVEELEAGTGEPSIALMLSRMVRRKSLAKEDVDVVDRNLQWAPADESCPAKASNQSRTECRVARG